MYTSIGLRVLGVLPLEEDVALVIDVLSVALSVQLEEFLERAGVPTSSQPPPDGEHP